ncbi:hypothetical protein FS837_002717 [Tulasnella sp. UAMH 9824]|nr:hypothetical protein FS837_002717 [Tulasnella sp. UAMH 9824]
MKPPSEDATVKALDILLDSIQKENGVEFMSSIPVQQLAKSADALSLARSHLHKKVDDLISRIQHHRNRAAPLHRLPQEIFETILEKYAVRYGPKGLFRLIQVGRLWHTTIVNCPHLWTRVASRYPARVVRLIIMRSKSLSTLEFNWHWAHPRSKEGEEILEMAVANSARFKSMEITVRQEDSFDSIRRLLNSPSTALEHLQIETDNKHALEDRSDGLGTFVLSEGVPLKYLDLHQVSLNYESPRFSGLFTLRLDRSAVPTSVVLLVQMLSITSQLETLELSRPTRMTRVEQGIWPPSPLANLPCLSFFFITRVPRSYCAALLSSLYAPASRCYVEIEDISINDPVEELDAILWQPGSSPMAALLGAYDDTDPSRRIDITGERHQVVIRVNDHGCYACLSVLEQLGQRTASSRINPGTETAEMEDWMCPGLLYIGLDIPTDEAERRTHVSALLSLIKKRWSGDGGLAPARQPGRLEIMCSRSSHAYLQEVAKQVQKTVPSFQLSIK